MHSPARAGLCLEQERNRKVNATAEDTIPTTCHSHTQLPIRAADLCLLAEPLTEVLRAQKLSFLCLTQVVVLLMSIHQLWKSITA